MLTPALKCLELQVHMPTYCEAPLRHEEELDRATASETIISSLLDKEDILTDAACDACGVVWGGLEQKPLSALRLHGFNMSRVGAHLLQAVDVRYLDTLCLHFCEQEDIFLKLTAADQSTTCKQLRRLAIAQAPEIQPGSGSDGLIDDFMKSFHTLESLIISAPKTAALKPSILAVSSHADNLRILYLDCDHSRLAESYDYVHMERLAIREKLEQLALTMPEIDLDSKDYTERDEWEWFVERLWHLPALRTFHVLNLPGSNELDSKPQDDDLGRVYVETCLKAYAKHIFYSLPEEVTALGIGKRCYNPEHIGEVRIDPHLYVRGALIDAAGNETLEAVKTSRPDLREVEPVSNILDFDPEDVFTKYWQEGIPLTRAWRV